MCLMNYDPFECLTTHRRAQCAQSWVHMRKATDNPHRTNYALALFPGVAALVWRSWNPGRHSTNQSKTKKFSVTSSNCKIDSVVPVVGPSALQVQKCRAWQLIHQVCSVQSDGWDSGPVHNDLSPSHCLESL